MSNWLKEEKKYENNTQLDEWFARLPDFPFNILFKSINNVHIAELHFGDAHIIQV